VLGDYAVQQGVRAVCDLRDRCRDRRVFIVQAAFGAGGWRRSISSFCPRRWSEVWLATRSRRRGAFLRGPRRVPGGIRDHDLQPDVVDRALPIVCSGKDGEPFGVRAGVARRSGARPPDLAAWTLALGAIVLPMLFFGDRAGLEIVRPMALVILEAW
jgi:hypothetical protein